MKLHTPNIYAVTDRFNYAVTKHELRENQKYPTQDTLSLHCIGVVEATDIGQLFHDKSLGFIYLSLVLAQNIDKYLPARVMHGRTR